jgi:hypothetical protein
MSSFCASCGTATGGGKFCPKCGAPQGTAAPSISQSPYAPPVKRKSPVLKIVLIVLALFFVVGIAAVVKGYFFLKETYHEAKQEMAQAKMGKVERTQAGCEILGKEQVAAILGTPVAATKGNEAGDIREFCNYLSPTNVAAQKDDDADSSVAKQILNAAKNKPLLGVQIYRGNAGIALITIKTAARFSGQGAVKVPGPWEEAYFGPQDMTLAVRKGQNGVLLDLTQVSKKHDAGIAIAKAMMANF